jgi:hypothetical protein
MEFVPTKKEEQMFRYTFRVDTPFGFEITDVIAESIEAAKAEVVKRSRRDSLDVSLISSFDLKPQEFLAW